MKLKAFKLNQVGEVDPRIFSSFIEHMGRAVYTGIYEPSHPLADEDGFRKDVLDLVRDLNIEYVRYPGGNFVSGYDWKDGIGPKEDRPSKLELAWRTIETNEIGIHEFDKWAKKANLKIMSAANLGTGTEKEAAELIEYCNFPKGTKWSDLRRQNGDEEPFDIKLWCLGNEMDGDWQICHKTADEYGRKAHETAKLLKLVDNDIELVVAGSSGPLQPTYPEWDRKVLEHTYDDVEYISLHRYYWNEDNDQDFACSYVDFNNFIKTIASTVEYVRALKRSNKQVYLSMDEWNVWYLNDVELKDWESAPKILEDNYSFLDSLVFSGMLITMLNNCDTVKIACLAQLVNVIAPIFTEEGGESFKQTIYYPFYYFSKYGRGTVLKTINDVDKISTKYGQADAVISTTVMTEEELNIFVVNADLNNSHEVNFDIDDLGKYEFIEQIIMHNLDLNLTNTFENKDAVVPEILTEENRTLKQGTFSLFRYKLIK